MIKKSVFEQELEAGMQRELRKNASTEAPDLVQAAECLHAAMEIFEEAGMTAKADAILAVLEKIAATNRSHVQTGMPSIQKLMEAGLTQRDMQAFGKGDLLAKAKFNLVLHQLGFNEHQIASFIGKHNVMSKKDAEEILDPNRSFGKIWEWMKNPTAPVDPNNIQPNETIEFQPVDKGLPIMPGDQISFQSLPQPTAPAKGNGEELKFNSIATKHRKPKRPDTIHDWHTKGLTPEKMVENLKHHGTEFNMSDDGSSDGDLDPEIADSLGVERADDMNDVDIPQGPEFEGDWKTWKAMMGNEEPPSTKPMHKMKEISLEDLDDASDFVISDDILEVDEKELPQDFEDERD